MVARNKGTAGTTPKAEPKVASIDFANLPPAREIAADEIRHTRTTKVDRSPVLGWLQESWDTDTGKEQALPDQAQADEFVKLLRNGVNRLGYGLKVKALPQDDGTVVVQYAAIERKVRAPKE